MMPEKINACLVQMRCQQNRQSNLDYSIAAIRTAAEQDADLVVLPELHLDSYFCQNKDPKNFQLAETLPGPITDIYAQLSAELAIVIIATFFEKRAPGVYHNTAMVFDRDGSIAGKYRKMHIPDDPDYYEKFYFTPGDTGFVPINTSIGKLGVMICWDQWYPEAARLMTLSGAKLLIYPSAIGWDRNDSSEVQTRQLAAWQMIQRSHAIANGISVLACNRIGFEPSPDNRAGIDFWGNSFIVGPFGETIAQTDHSEQTLLNATLDIHESEAIRNTWPFLRDRRIDAYQKLTQCYIDEN